jgi:hypothetical protein
MEQLKKMDFNEWFPTWHKAASYEYWSRNQGTGLRRAHELMRQAGRDYQKYLRKKEKHDIQTTSGKRKSI